MIVVDFNNMTHGFTDLCEVVMAGDVVERRGGKVSEHAATIGVQLTDPRQSLVQCPHRRLNPWVSLAEFPWIIAGRNDVAWLSTYLPNAADFSDDGMVWRAGYGPRMRAWKGYWDQLAFAVGQLEFNSRQAVMVLWDPAADSAAGLNGTVDQPCTNWLSFQKRKSGAVDLTVGMRSNDLWWGLSGVNVVNFTLLQRAVASWVGASVGSYYHIATNLHLYERHWDRAWSVIKSPTLRPEAASEEPVENEFCANLSAFTVECKLALEKVARADASGLGLSSPFLRDWVFFMTSHYLRGEPGVLARRLLPLRDTRSDWVNAAIIFARSEQ